MLRLCFLGEQRVIEHGAAESKSLVVGRALELLAYLVVNAGVPQERERLAGLLWPESTGQQSRTNLRRELHGLRQLPDLYRHIESSGTALLWQDGPGTASDVGTFQRNCREVLRLSDTGNETGLVQFGQAAIDAYAGDLLPGLYGEWVLAEREILHRHCIEVCDKVAASASASSGQPDLAMAAAQRRLQLAPLEEAGYQRLMELQVAAGDTAAAVRSYHRCAAVLESELGLETGPRTRELASELLGSTPSLRISGGRSVMLLGPGPAAGRPVGREPEEVLLQERWNRAIAGNPGLLVLKGDAGIGKTRLLVSLLGRISKTGALTAYGRCFSGGGRTALAPVAQWLASKDFHAGERETDRPGAGEGGNRANNEAARLLPEALAPWHGPGAALVDAWQRRAYYERLAGLVLAPARPVLLILDDLQWCDAETLEFLAVLLSTAPSSPLLIAATARTNELAANIHILEALQALRTGRWIQELDLAPLDAASSAALAAAELGKELSDDDAVLLHAASGGFPLHIVEAARAMRRCAGGQLALTEVLRDSGDGRGVLRRRFEQCSSQARDVATLAAAVGREFSLGLLARAWTGDEASLVQAVDELWRRRILREQRGGYDFTHDLLRQCAYELSTPPQRWLLHRRLAQAMEAEHHGVGGIVAADLAEQYRQAGEPGRAMGYFVQAGDAATRIFASAQALADYQQGLDLLADCPGRGDTKKSELAILLRMPPSLTALHGYSSAQLQATLERILALAGDLGSAQAQASALIGLFAATFVQGKTVQSHALASRALNLARDLPELLGQASFAVGGAETSLGRSPEAIAHFDRACVLASTTHSHILGTRVGVHARAWSSHAHWLSGDNDGALALSAEAVERATFASHPYSLAVALAYRGVLLQWRLGGDANGGGRDELASVAAELETLCTRYKFAYYGQWGAILRGWLTGSEKGSAIIGTAIRELRAAQALARMPYWQCLLAQTQQECGKTREAGAVLAAAESFAHQNFDVWWLPEVLRQRALLAEPAAAQLLLGRAEKLADEQHNPTLSNSVRATRQAANAGRTGPS
ncbi:AAA family ATPase [Arthrobacter sp. H35-D1]|uniref:AAA family ATPase n=1 Tax=Arthrobacter sp. H35-D1 TaxID=3046202 RepID=UPI0024B94DC5|nr:AAA family ATPase [Arthrobacter sp. H35-D1]MDJ0315117.1 AAA family ATPase [Arthrobacter sp. H35-D1]